jgi:hypothetical protein
MKKKKEAAMNRFLKIVFYQFYYWGCKYNFANSPHLSAMYMLSLLLTINAGCLSMIFLSVIGFDDFVYLLNSKILTLCVLAIITTIIYLLYTRHKKYLDIFNEFNSCSLDQKKKFKLISTMYIVLTLLFFFLMAFLLGVHKRGQL